MGDEVISGGGVILGSRDILDGGVNSGGGEILVAESFFLMETSGGEVILGDRDE